MSSLSTTPAEVVGHSKGMDTAKESSHTDEEKESRRRYSSPSLIIGMFAFKKRLRTSVSDSQAISGISIEVSFWEKKSVLFGLFVITFAFFFFFFFCS